MSGDIPLRFSSDTLRFDTVFTTLGSATRFIKVYNDQEDAIIINDIDIQGQMGDFFRINADGISSPVDEDIRIEGQDSIYIFAEVTIDPDQSLSESPFFIEDHVTLQSNGQSYTFYLEAWGQNANYIPSKTSGSQVNLLSCNFNTITWDDPRPYVIYGALLIDSCELVIPKGTQVYVHGGIAINELGIYNDGLLFFLPDGSIKVQGTVDEPVTIQTDRLEHSFDQLPGQWAGIILGAGSTGNEFNYTTIKNSIVGLSVDSTASVSLKNNIIAYTSGDGLRATHAFVDAENCLFFQNGGYGLNLNFGGNYTFDFCTVVNTDNQLSAVNMNNIKCTNPLCEGEILFNGLTATFKNCIFTGNDRDEISLLDGFDGSDPSKFNYFMSNCIVQVDELLDSENFPNFFDRCAGCINSDFGDTLFLEPDNYNYQLDTMSIAIDQGISIPQITIDLIGHPRDMQPDIGCYEFQN